MADIKLKDISKLETWNTKELRKLRMTIKNRISALEMSAKPKELSKSHPLFQLESGQCKSLLEKILKVEKKLARS